MIPHLFFDMRLKNKNRAKAMTANNTTASGGVPPKAGKERKKTPKTKPKQIA